MCCSRCRSQAETLNQVEAAEDQAEVNQSFRNSRCFLIGLRDASGRRRCKCCCRRSNDED